MGDPNSELGSLFAPVPLPPAVVDPTGGLLEPVIAPINFVVTRMEEEILMAISDSMLLLRLALKDGTNALADASNLAFADVNRIANEGVVSALNSLQQALYLGGGMTSVESAIARVESIASSAYAGLTQIVSAMLNTSGGAIGGYRGKIADTIAAAKKETYDAVMAQARGALGDLENVKLMAQARATQALAGAARERDLAVRWGGDRYREVAAAARSEAGGTLRAAEGRAREGAARIRAARGRLAVAGAGASAALDGAASSVMNKGTLISQKAALDAKEAELRARRAVEFAVLAGTFVAIVGTMAYGYFGYVRPHIKAVAAGAREAPGT